MTKTEYEFMTNILGGEKGVKYREAYQSCRGFGWTTGFDINGKVVYTREGAKRVRAYQMEENYKRVDCI